MSCITGIIGFCSIDEINHNLCFSCRSWVYCVVLSFLIVLPQSDFRNRDNEITCLSIYLLVRQRPNNNSPLPIVWPFPIGTPDNPVLICFPITRFNGSSVRLCQNATDPPQSRMQWCHPHLLFWVWSCLSNSRTNRPHTKYVVRRCKSKTLWACVSPACLGFSCQQKLIQFSICICKKD